MPPRIFFRTDAARTRLCDRSKTSSKRLGKLDMGDGKRVKSGRVELHAGPRAWLAYIETKPTRTNRRCFGRRRAWCRRLAFYGQTQGAHFDHRQADVEVALSGPVRRHIVVGDCRRQPRDAFQEQRGLDGRASSTLSFEGLRMLTSDARKVSSSRAWTSTWTL